MNFPIQVTKYTLTIPSLRFAGLLATWAAQHDIEFEHSVIPADKSSRSTVVPKQQPIVLTFHSIADRAWLMEIARAKIAALRTARNGKRGERKARQKHVVACDDIADRLQADYEAMT